MRPKPFPLIGQYRFGWIIFWVTLSILINALAFGLSDSIRGLSPRWMVPFGILSVFSGWAMGGILTKRNFCYILGMVAGAMILVLINSGAFINLFFAFLRSLRMYLPLSPTQALTTIDDRMFFLLFTAASRLITYAQDMSLWFSNLLRSNAEFNLHATNFVWGSLYWMVIFSAGWQFRCKSHAFIANLSPLLLLAGVLGYSRKNALGLILTLGSTLVLMAIVEHLKREDLWHSKQIDYSEELRFDLITLTIPIVFVILIISWVFPNITIEKIRDVYDSVFQVERREQVMDSLGLDQVPLESFEFYQQDPMPRSHLLGSGPELSDIIVMEIDIGERYLPTQINDPGHLPKYYWFGRSYDIFTGEGWTTGPIKKEIISADATIQTADLQDYRIVTLSIKKTGAAFPTLYTPGMPLSVNQRIIAGWHEATNEFFTASINAIEYQVTAAVMNLDEERLRQANEQPPEALLNAYLQLPVDTPSRVLKLSKSLTEDKKTPYEKAKSIETYLRGFEYAIDLPSPPGNRDLVDYFLFDLKKGYCDYFASAMVVLSRAAGLPSRITIGYATGNYDYTRGVFVVSEDNAHAWPEVFIAPYGWVPFEPTASLSTFSWLSDADAPHTTVDPIDEIEKPSDQVPTWLILLGIGLLIMVISSIVIIWYQNKHIIKINQSSSHQIERIYHRMRSYLVHMFFLPSEEKTPREYQLALSKHLAVNSTTKITKTLALQITSYMSSITHLHEYGVYSAHELLPSQIKTAVQSWRRIQLGSWILKIAMTIENV